VSLLARDAEYERMTSGFISSAVHELRTPLTVIRGFSELLLSQQQAGDLPDDTHREYLEYIVENAKRLQGIVDALLDLDRLQSAQGISLNRSACKVHNVAVEALLAFKEEREKSFLLRLSEGETIVSVDRQKMRQVLEALLQNAFKFSAGTPVYVRGHVVGGSYQFCVEDEGDGMTPQQVERVFDPFYRVDSSNTAPEGMGLGLAWAKGVVEAHGGTISVESELGRGTRVNVTLPLG
jgi:signal transduction histidine kinase